MNLQTVQKNIYEINNLARYLEMDELDPETLADTRESLISLLEAQSSEPELALRNLEQMEQNCKDMSDYFKEKSVRFKEKKDNLKKLIKATMEHLGVRKIETVTGSFSIRKNAPSLIIENEALIPKEFITIIQTEKVEKNEIKKALKDGKEINGVRLENSESLIVK